MKTHFEMPCKLRYGPLKKERIAPRLSSKCFKFRIDPHFKKGGQNNFQRVVSPESVSISIKDLFSLLINVIRTEFFVGKPILVRETPKW